MAGSTERMQGGTVMTAAREPGEIHRLFERLAASGDVEGIARLYEEGARFVRKDGRVLEGRVAIRDEVGGMLAVMTSYRQEVEGVVEAGGVALLSTRWTLEGRMPDGTPFSESGRTADVARRQPDGTWLMAIDSPWGGQEG